MRALLSIVFAVLTCGVSSQYYRGYKPPRCPGGDCPPPPPPFIPPEIYCPPVTCRPPCAVVSNYGECPRCFCPPPPDNPTCPKISICKPGCSLKINALGCKYCHCEPICPPLNCPKACFPTFVVGRCPYCTCPGKLY